MYFKNREVDIAYVKSLSKNELDSLSYAIRQEIIRVISTNGGHLSANLGVVELELALARYFDFPTDKLLIDVGHQSYTYKIITGRDMNTLRKKNGVSGFQKREESIYDVFEAGHSSTSLSAALGMAIARDAKNEKYEVIALIGDASIVNGMAFEALNDIGQQKHKVIIVLNDNDMSVSKTVGAISKSSHSINSIYEHFGLDLIGPIDGHNIPQIEAALAKAHQSSRSSVIHVYTEKGKGYRFAETDSLGIYHGISPFKVQTGETIPSHPHQISYSHFFGQLVENALDEDPLISVICPAMVLGSGLLSPFEKYPSRCFDVGIAEEHAMTLASGMALNGLKPIISMYSTFLQRAFDQLSHDLARMNCNSILLIDRAGLVGEDGETHQGIFDEGFIMNTPNMVLTTPSDKGTSRALFELARNYVGPFAIRFPRGYFTVLDEDQDYHLEFGRWLETYHHDEAKVAVITLGNTVERLKRLIEPENLPINLYNALFLKPFDTKCLDSLLDFEKIIIINPMGTKIGFVSAVSDYLLNKDYRGEIKTLAIKDEFIKQATLKEQYKDNCLDDEYLFSVIKDSLKTK